MTTLLIFLPTFVTDVMENTTSYSNTVAPPSRMGGAHLSSIVVAVILPILKSRGGWGFICTLLEACFRSLMYCCRFLHLLTWALILSRGFVRPQTTHSSVSPLYEGSSSLLFPSSGGAPGHTLACPSKCSRVTRAPHLSHCWKNFLKPNWRRSSLDSFFNLSTSASAWPRGSLSFHA